jgi:hypothetical protein
LWIAIADNIRTAWKVASWSSACGELLTAPIPGSQAQQSSETALLE